MTSRGRVALLTSFLAVSISAAFLVKPLRAQVLYGSIGGTVTDKTGAVLPNAHVTVTNPLTGLVRETNSNASGVYLVPNLPEGTYDVKVTAQGFKPFETKGLPIRVGAVVNQDIQLEVGAATQEVTVSASGAVLQTTKADVSTSLGTTPVENLPTGFYRNYQALLLLTPGAAGNFGFTGALADTPERGLAIPINGMDPASNSTRIDGAQSIFLWKPGAAALYVEPVEAILEVKVTTNSYDPEKGMAGSAAMDVITKSGTNDMHGTLFWYHFNQHFAACDGFDQACKWRVYTPTQPQSKPKLILNDTGGNLGGPIKKDKLFYFFNYDGVFQRDTPDGYFSVPMADMRGGDFTRFLRSQVHQCLALNPDGSCATAGPLMMVPTTDGHGNIGPMVPLQQGMIFDPTTGNPDGTGRAVFAYGGTVNAIPKDRFSSIANTILGYWPTPNIGSGLWLTDAQNNVTHDYFLNAPERFNRNNFDVKVDWNRTENHFIWAKYAAMKTLTASTCGFNATIGGPCPANQSGNVPVLVQTATLGHTWNLTPTFLLDGSLGFSRMSQKGFPQDFGKNIGLSVLGIPGTNDPNDIRYSGMPGITVSGFDGLGSPYGWEPFYRNDWTVTIAQNASWMHGPHALRFGVDLVHNHLNHWQPENGMGPRGGINFSNGNYTFHNLNDLCPAPSCVGTDVTFGTETANNFADFLLGTFDEDGRSIQFAKATGKDWWYGFHFLDQWKVTPKFTANLGLRYEYYPVPSRDALGKGIEQYNPANNTYLLGGLGGNPRNLGVRTQKNMFAPRVGLAYELNPKTVIRAGFGSTFDTYPILRELRGAFPAVISTDNAYNSSATDAAGNPIFDTAGSCAAAASAPYSNNLCDYQGLGSFATGIPPVLPANSPLFAQILAGKIDPMPTNVDARYLGPGLLKRGRVETWNITGERRLPGDSLLGVGYVGNHLSHGWGLLDPNASRLDQLAPLGSAFGRTAVTNQLQGFLDSHYNSLQVTLDRHYSKGLYIKGAYTYSKALNMSYDTDAWGGAYWQAPLFAAPDYLAHNRGMADIDRRHIFRIGYVWDLPFGPGHALASKNRIGRAIFGGWQANGVWSTTSGGPTTIFGAPQFYGGIDEHQTLDQVAPLQKEGCLGPGDGCFWYNPLSFAPVPNTSTIDPATGQPYPDGKAHQARFGSTGRNIAVYGPGHSNLDQSLFRHFKLSERWDMQFRVEALNVFNHPIWDWQNNNEWGTSDYCWGGGPASNPCGNPFMQAISTLPFSSDQGAHRVIRLGLRLAF